MTKFLVFSFKFLVSVAQARRLLVLLKTKNYQLKTFSVQPFRGFTLIEMLVSVALFSVVMLISVGSLIAMAEAARKAETIKSVLNNLNFALDSMSRTVRTGYSYHCTDAPGNTYGLMGSPASPQNCGTYGSSYLALEGSQGNPNGSADQIIFRLNNGRVEQSSDSGTNFLPLTAPEVVIQSLRFYVTGAPTGDGSQPRAVVTLSGYIQVTPTTQTALQLQTTLTQRLHDQ